METLASMTLNSLTMAMDAMCRVVVPEQLAPTLPLVELGIVKWTVQRGFRGWGFNDSSL